jgi:hypothetical protein
LSFLIKSNNIFRNIRLWSEISSNSHQNSLKCSKNLEKEGKLVKFGEFKEFFGKRGKID